MCHTTFKLHHALKALYIILWDASLDGLLLLSPFCGERNRIKLMTIESYRTPKKKKELKLK